MESSMTEINAQYVASSTTRRRIVVLGLFTTWGIIVWCLLRGNPENSLHTSALAWSFTTNMVLTFAYSFGTMVQDYFKK